MTRARVVVESGSGSRPVDPGAAVQLSGWVSIQDPPLLPVACTLAPDDGPGVLLRVSAAPDRPADVEPIAVMLAPDTVTVR